MKEVNDVYVLVLLKYEMNYFKQKKIDFKKCC